MSVLSLVSITGAVGAWISEKTASTVRAENLVSPHPERLVAVNEHGSLLMTQAEADRYGLGVFLFVSMVFLFMLIVGCAILFDKVARMRGRSTLFE